MKDNLFDNQEKIDANLATLKIGIETPFWKLMSDILRANIEVVKGRILNGKEGETIDDIDKLRDELTIYENVLNTPENLISKYEAGSKGGVDLDPYEKQKEPDEVAT